ncbi:MAG TPA: VOC family protein [Verrucomicrobiae bacterium]|nr:VOC family protein [Verrucomicrobiae bacterium]
MPCQPSEIPLEPDNAYPVLLMRLNHIHVAVQDLSGALDWLERVWQVKAEFQNERMATLSFGEFILILDAAEADSPATIGFESENCDEDFRGVVERGAVAIEPPSDKPWGVRCAYIQGPGGLKFEIEQPLK